MMLVWTVVIVALGVLVPLSVPCSAQQQDAIHILNSLPSAMYDKVQALAHLLKDSIQTGQLTDAEIQQAMLSGQLGERLKLVNPEASRLLDEISELIKHGEGPDEQSLVPLLGGLGVSLP